MSITTTKCRPILMSGPMVVAARREENPKTQTRRIISHNARGGCAAGGLQRRFEVTTTIEVDGVVYGENMIRHLQQQVNECRAAGFIDDAGNVRKVLGGGLPITADGFYIAASHIGDLYQPNKDRIMAWGPFHWRNWAPVDFSLAYTSEDAARAALAASPPSGGSK